MEREVDSNWPVGDVDVKVNNVLPLVLVMAEHKVGTDAPLFIDKVHRGLDIDDTLISTGN